ncbi:MAG: hypothetical protein AMXMBFR33_57960 [Candidatus Xenobia bacterium]
MRALNHLRALLNSALEDEFFVPTRSGEPNPVTAYLTKQRRQRGKESVLKVNDQRKRYLTEAEFRRLRDYMAPGDFAVVELAILTGLRSSEIFELRRQDVDLPASVLTIPKGKSGRVHHVRLAGRAVEILRDAMAQHGGELIFTCELEATGFGPRGSHSPGEFRKASSLSVKHAFKNRTPRMTANWFKRHRFRAALKALGIENLRFHDLRHTCASWLVQQGETIQEVSRILGHSTTRMSERYAHLNDHSQQRAVSRLEAKMASIPGASHAGPEVVLESGENRANGEIGRPKASPTRKQKTPPKQGFSLVEPHGFEPRTSSVQGRRSPS